MEAFSSTKSLITCFWGASHCATQHQLISSVAPQGNFSNYHICIFCFIPSICLAFQQNTNSLMRGTGSVIHHKPQKPICCDRPYKYSESTFRLICVSVSPTTSRERRTLLTLSSSCHSNISIRIQKIRLVVYYPAYKLILNSLFSIKTHRYSSFLLQLTWLVTSLSPGFLNCKMRIRFKAL